MNIELSVALPVIATLLAILATFSVARLNRKQTTFENYMTRQQGETLAQLNFMYSKEAHAANHLYTRQAMHLEEASRIVGELEFWAEKCVVPRTRTDFGTKKEIAERMSRSFEDLTKHTMQHSFSFAEIKGFQHSLGDLMGSVNYIENMVHSDNFEPDSDAWKQAVNQFRSTLSPLANHLHSEIRKRMHP